MGIQHCRFFYLKQISCENLRQEEGLPKYILSCQSWEKIFSNTITPGMLMKTVANYNYKMFCRSASYRNSCNILHDMIQHLDSKYGTMF